MDKLKGGKGDKETTKTLSKKFNKPEATIKKAITTGSKVESEHTEDKNIAKDIAKDHVSEDPEYYKKLKKVEEKVKILKRVLENITKKRVILKENKLGPAAVINNELPNISNLECDGATRVLDYALTKNKIPHTVYVGKVLTTSKKGWVEVIPLHYWIKLGNNLLDFKAQMWLDSDAPNGLFSVIKEKGGFVPDDWPEYMYQGEPIELNTSETIYNILVMSGIN